MKSLQSAAKGSFLLILILGKSLASEFSLPCLALSPHRMLSIMTHAIGAGRMHNSITDPWKGRMHSRDASAKNSTQNQRGRVDGLNVAPSGWSDFIGLLSMTSISLPDTQESLTAEEVSAGVLGFVHCNESRARIPRETLTGGYRLATQLGFDNFRPNFSGWVAVEFLWAAPLQSGPAVERSWQMSCHSTASPRSHITGLISKVFVCNTKSKFRVLPFSSSQLPPPHQLQPSLAVAITVTRPLFGLSS